MMHGQKNIKLSSITVTISHHAPACFKI